MLPLVIGAAVGVHIGSYWCLLGLAVGYVAVNIIIAGVQAILKQ